MDPLTQGSLGSAFAQSGGGHRGAGLATLCGFLGGMAPDLDVLIRSSTDPLLFLEYHRQFTHSLIFIPVGAALVAGALWGALVRHWKQPFRRVYWYCLLGYATHALLDACTSYGTLLLWPFSNQRFAWNSVSIIDPLVTVPLVAGVILTARREHPGPARAACVWVLAYLMLGVVARDAAREEGYRLARARGHDPLHLEAKPSLGNLVLWKTVYRVRDTYYVDAVRLGPTPRVYEGAQIAALDPRRDLPWLDRESVQGRDLERFRWFSMGYLALDPLHPTRVMDLRYSLVPNEVRPLWSIELDPQNQSSHVRYQTHREGQRDALRTFLAMLWGDPLPASRGAPRSLESPLP